MRLAAATMSSSRHHHRTKHHLQQLSTAYQNESQRAARQAPNSACYRARTAVTAACVGSLAGRAQLIR